MTRLRVLLVGALAAAFALAGGTALAQTSSRLSGEVTSPAFDGEEFVRTTVTVAGRFAYSSSSLGTGRIDRVDIELRAERAQAIPAGSRYSKEPNASSTTFDWTTPTLSWNGPYVARVTATGTPNPGFSSAQETLTIDRRFALAVPPRTPTNVAAVFSESTRKVTITWGANPEPDLIGYQVQRDGAALGLVKASAERIFTDTPEPGTYSYRVVAIREGARTGEGVSSSPSSAATATVSPPPTTTAPSNTTPPTTAAGSQQGGTTNTTAGNTTSSGQGSTSGPPLARSGRVDLSQFGALLDAQRRASRPQPVQPPDPGFEEQLPFDTTRRTEPEGSDETDEGSTVAQGPDSGRASRLIYDDSDRRRSLTFFAAGLLLFVMAGHGWYFVNQSKHVDDLEPTDPGSMHEEPPQGAAEMEIPDEQWWNEATTPVGTPALAYEDTVEHRAVPGPDLAQRSWVPPPPPDGWAHDTDILNLGATSGSDELDDVEGFDGLRPRPARRLSLPQLEGVRSAWEHASGQRRDPGFDVAPPLTDLAALAEPDSREQRREARRERRASGGGPPLPPLEAPHLDVPAPEFELEGGDDVWAPPQETVSVR